MARVSAQDCLRRVPNHFALCVLAAERARQIAAGSAPTVRCNNKAAVTALREIAAGHVAFRELVDDTIRGHIADGKIVELGRSIGAAQKRRSEALK